jgi:hypothetical protein
VPLDARAPDASDAPALSTADVRPAWRTVAVPSEHGGWGLTLEPVLLGLLLVWSPAGLLIGLAAMLVFLVRTPLKLALVDRRRGRWLPRTGLAWRVAGVELALIAALAAAAIVVGGLAWLLPVAAALPFFAVELWYDVRSRGRRLPPELCGAVGVTTVAAAVVVAGEGAWSLAIAASMVLAARAIASVPFVRAQIARLRHRTAPLWRADAFQLGGAVAAIAAAFVDGLVVAGAGAVIAVGAIQLLWLRRPVPPAKVLGLWQMAFGLAVVVACAAGAHLLD